MRWSESAHEGEALDRDRVASMADEGGAAAAHVEEQPGISRPVPARRGRPSTAVMLALGGAAAGVLLLALRSARRGRGTDDTGGSGDAAGADDLAADEVGPFPRST